MPGFGASAEHKGGPASDGADLTRVDDFSAGLDTGTKEGVGCATDEEAFGFCQNQQVLGIFELHREWLFAVSVFACLKNVAAYRSVGSGDREVNHELDLGMCQ